MRAGSLDSAAASPPSSPASPRATRRPTPASDRLVMLRTVLERTQPIDRKLKYQVDKLVRLAAAGPKGTGADAAAEDGDQLQYRPDPSNLVPKVRRADRRRAGC